MEDTSEVGLPTDCVAELLPQQADALLLKLAQRLRGSACAADQNLGHLEEELLRGSHEVFRQMLEKAAHKRPMRLRRYVRTVRTN